MTYTTFITSLRNQTGDVRRRVHVDFIGDGATTIFQMPADTYPIYDDTSSYIIKVGGTQKTESSDYTLDKEAGTIVFQTAPTNGTAITIDCSAVYITNASWLSIINSTIASLGDDFWKEFTDDTNFVSVANMLSLSLSAHQANCIAVYEFTYRDSTSEDWRQVAEKTNWRYSRDENKIYLGIQNAFNIADKPFKVRGLKTYTLGDDVSDTIDVQDRFMTIIEYGCIARYWRWRYKNVVELISKMSQEASRTPLQELIMLSDRFDRLYEQEKAKLKPQKPAKLIPLFKNGGGIA